jgi:single-strand DNA-binding protein
MATDINNVVLIGRLTRDPDIRQVNTTSVASFTLAANRTYPVKGPGGQTERREESLFIDCSAWSGLSEIVRQYCHKGKQVCVSGRLKQDTWETPEGKRSKIQIVVENLQLLGGRGEGQSFQAQPGWQGQAPPQQPAGSYGQPAGQGYTPPPNPGYGQPPQSENPMSQTMGTDMDESDMPF